MLYFKRTRTSSGRSCNSCWYSVLSVMLTEPYEMAMQQHVWDGAWAWVAVRPGHCDSCASLSIMLYAGAHLFRLYFWSTVSAHAHTPFGRRLLEYTPSIRARLDRVRGRASSNHTNTPTCAHYLILNVSASSPSTLMSGRAIFSTLCRLIKFTASGCGGGGQRVIGGPIINITLSYPPSPLRPTVVHGAAHG